MRPAADGRDKLYGVRKKEKHDQFVEEREINKMKERSRKGREKDKMKKRNRKREIKLKKEIEKREKEIKWKKEIV